MNGLIGYTGFVGGNLDKQIDFDKTYNSSNISEIEGEKFDLLVCAGIKAQKWFANKNPEKDLEDINNLLKHLENVEADKFVLISTIDVYDKSIDINENYKINKDKLEPYGRNRYYAEQWIKNNFDDSLIIRLPALFGEGLKKNFIYDLIHRIPKIIVKKKMKELKNDLPDTEFKFIKNSYEVDKNDNYTLKNDISKKQNENLKNILEKIGFTSLVFTDSRSEFPFYYLDYLWHHLNVALKNNISLLNLAVEPISAKEIANKCFDLDFTNIKEGQEPSEYDIKTIYSDKFDGEHGYIFKKGEIISQIKGYLNKEGIR
ncbi:hypothetical protein SAMN04515654_12814 [Halanaerobium congolense]|uniref:NAD-dependent epimerase/dehydratase domain-containing protein n=1 Tax=Halanaerobium congolense TaxID=54121 RepID=A0A1G8R3E3_9FIRM|nr:NAD-dependent epimerase/dehydratase family protein [Halanaerobium congolense]SDJ10920.1 hypothetical protein SAMN04515654_12814 [Halanaerobium congolense]SET65821.1 hypothetical protein SAMN04515653_12324 [Halanaerobium congolense]